MQEEFELPSAATIYPNDIVRECTKDRTGKKEQKNITMGKFLHCIGASTEKEEKEKKMWKIIQTIFNYDSVEARVCFITNNILLSRENLSLLSWL